MKYCLMFLIVLILFPQLNGYGMAQSSYPTQSLYQNQIQRAVQYLASHYNSKIGLIYESEDSGNHWLGRTEYVGYHWRYNETYFLFSDNLFAEYALEPWRLDVSTQINATIKKYSPPFSNKFEAVIGIPVGPDRGARDVIVATGTGYAILYRIHDGPIGDANIPFADSIVYKALSLHYLGQESEALLEMRRALQLWNGTCVLDHGVTETELSPGGAPSDIGWCTNMKLALLLYGARVLRIENEINYPQMEEALWSKQQANGGITTLADGHGNPSGSANCETTSLALLVYADSLISRLQGLQVKTDEASSPFLLIIVLVLATIAVYSSTRKQRHDDDFVPVKLRE